MGTRPSQADINHELSHKSSAVFYHVLSRTKGKREITPQLLRSVALSTRLGCPTQHNQVRLSIPFPPPLPPHHPHQFLSPS